MVNNLACARARESAEAWLADRKLALPTPPRVSAAWAETAMADAYRDGWMDRDQVDPDNPAEALRQIAEGMVDGETIKGVDHASFDAAAAKLDEPGVPDDENPEASAEWFEGARWRTEGVADLTAFRVTTGDPRFDPAAPVVINGFLYHPAHQGD